MTRLTYLTAISAVAKIQLPPMPATGLAGRQDAVTQLKLFPRSASATPVAIMAVVPRVIIRRRDALCSGEWRRATGAAFGPSGASASKRQRCTPTKHCACGSTSSSACCPAPSWPGPISGAPPADPAAGDSASGPGPWPGAGSGMGLGTGGSRARRSWPSRRNLAAEAAGRQRRTVLFHPPADSWVAAVHASEDEPQPIRHGPSFIDASRVLTCAHVVAS